MNRLKIIILGISEKKWAHSEKSMLDNKTLFHYGYGEDDVHHRYGVAMVVDPKVNKSVGNFISVSDRVVILQPRLSQNIHNLIQMEATEKLKQSIIKLQIS